MSAKSITKGVVGTTIQILAVLAIGMTFLAPGVIILSLFEFIQSKPVDWGMSGLMVAIGLLSTFLGICLMALHERYFEPNKYAQPDDGILKGFLEITGMSFGAVGMLFAYLFAGLFILTVLVWVFFR